MKHLYRATFTGGDVREQVYGRELTHAWRVTYTRNGSQATKYGFSGSREKAEKATKLPKACTDVTAEIVHAMKLAAPTKANAAKPKKAKPVKLGDYVTFALETQVYGVTATVGGAVAKVGRKYAYVTVAGALDPIKVAFDNLTKLNPDPIPLAQAA
jgi:hypothetical protein